MLAALVCRNMSIQCTIQERVVWLTAGEAMLEVQPEVLQDPAAWLAASDGPRRPGCHGRTIGTIGMGRGSRRLTSATGLRGRLRV
jgi:hypothetical protein